MNILAQAQDFFKKTQNMTRDTLQKAVKLLPKDVQNVYWEIRKVSYFIPENEVPDSRKEILSPSGKYKLVISRFTTRSGSWNYSQGVVYRKGDDNPIAVVQRDYSSFPNLFIESHPKGNFLVCGATYQGQTVIDLGTGNRRDNLSEGTDKGHGFCWSSYKYHEASQLLVVAGCHWACPYEYRFYDFSDPMSGWPELEMEEYVDDDDKWPVIEGDLVKTFESRFTNEEDEDSDEDTSQAPRTEKAIKTFRREGNKLVLVEEWVSEDEKERRQKQKEGNEKFEAWKTEFRATDPLYLAHKSRLNDHGLKPDDYESYGTTHDTWCPDFKEKETRWCKRIVNGKSKGYTIDLEWAVKTGPIKLEIYKDGKSLDAKFFGHSVEGMNAAFDHALALVGGGS
jgi:hypothetical protein